MYKFTQDSLLLGPDLDTYENQTIGHKISFNDSLDNMIQLLSAMSLNIYGLYTDDLLRSKRLDGIRLISTLSARDTFFVWKYCDNMGDAMTAEKWDNQEAVTKINNDVSDYDSLSPEERFKCVHKHERKAANMFISQFNLIVIYNYGTPHNYNVTPKADGKLIFKVNASTLMAEAYISGEPTSLAELLPNIDTNGPTNKWRWI